MNGYKVCATGHRPDKVGGHTDQAFSVLVRVASKALDDLRPMDLHAVISGMAQGWDQAVAVAALEKAIPLLAYVPHIGQESIWPREAQDRYRKILANAAVVRYVSEGGYHPHKMQIRNEAMVDDSNFVVALWNGSGGGTANCIEYARRKRKPLKNYWKYFEKQA